MKLVFKLVLLSFFLLLASSAVKSQNRRFYFAKITTENKKEIGLLYRVTKDSLVIQNENSQLISFKPQDIKVIALKIFKKRELRNFFKDVKYDDSRYEKIPNSEVKVLKQGETEPTLTEEISGRVMAGIFSFAGNAIINSVALTVYDDKIAKFKLNYSKSEYEKQLEELKYHSYSYIIKPDTKAELAKIKAISESSRIDHP
jgi:hypothetical protein